MEGSVIEVAKIAAPKKASKLKAIDPKAAEPSKPKVVVFGKPGVGKTWTALDFPSPFYIDTEGGADLSHYTDKLKRSGGAYFGPEQGSLDFAAVIDQVQALATEEHSYKTLIVDSFTKLYTTAIANEGERLGDKNAFGADKKPAIASTRRLVNWINHLDMSVILICHERTQWGVDGKGERTEIGVTFDGWDKLEYELHLCLNIIKSGPQRMARVRKSRLTGFPDGDAFQWSFDDFAARYGKDVINRKAAQVAIATAEQIAEINRLLGVVKVPEDYILKCVDKARVSSLEEIAADKAQAIINDLKGRAG